jgi:hypothetical protein
VPLITPVLWTLDFGQSATREKCKKTQSTINVRLLAGAGSFWTGQHTCPSFSVLESIGTVMEGLP